MEILVDDQVLASRSLEGELKPLQSWAPTLGSPWHKSFTGEIREIDLQAEPDAYAEALLILPGDTQHAEMAPEADDGLTDVFQFDGLAGTATQFADEAETALDLALLPLVDTEDGGQAIKMARDGAVTLPRAAFEDLYGSDGFVLDLSLRMDEGADNAGQLLRVHRSIVVHVTPRGEVRLEIQPEGADHYFDIRTQGATLLDGAWHDVQLRADGVAGVMQILVNGDVLAETDFEGQIKDYAHWEPTLGSTWHTNFTGEIRDFDLQVIPAPEPEDGPYWPEVFDFDGATATATQFGADGATVLDLDLPLVDTAEGGQAIKMARDGAVDLPKSAFAGLYGANGFILDLSLKMDEGAENAGQLLRVHRSVVVHVIHSGEIRLQIQPEGADHYFDIRTQGAGLLDGEWHDVQLRADGVAGVMQILVGGVVLAETAFEGQIKDVDVWDPTLGSTWHTNFTGQIRDFDLQAIPAPDPAPDATTQVAVADPAPQDSTDPAPEPTEEPVAEPTPTDPDQILVEALLAQMEREDSFAFGFGQSAHELDDGSTVQLDGISLADGGFSLGRHAALEDTARLGVSLVFTPHGTAVPDDGQILANGDRCSVGLQEGQLAISAQLADGTRYDLISDALALEDLAGHQLLVQIDDTADILRAVVDDEIVFYETGQDFELSQAAGTAWDLGDLTGTETVSAHVDQVQIFGFADDWLA